jgi:hypothetical protein
MEPITTKKIREVKKPNVATATIRLKRETKRRIQVELAKINKKDFGTKVRFDDLIGTVLSLLTNYHIKELQDRSMTNADRLEIQYRDFVKKHGATSKDDYLGKILSGDVVLESSSAAHLKINNV